MNYGMMIKTRGKETVGGYCSNTSEKGCGPSNSYSEDGEEIRPLRETSEIETQVLMASHILVIKQDDSRINPMFLA